MNTFIRFDCHAISLNDPFPLLVVWQHANVCTEMQENMWARLRDSRTDACLIHAT